MRIAIVVMALVGASCGSSAESDAVPTTRQALSARVELESTTLGPGERTSGWVVVQNDTGEALEVVGCGLFQVVLSNDDIEAEAIWPGCAQPYTVPTGESTYPVTVHATFSSCSNAVAHGEGTGCNPDGSVPSLPPGEYDAQLMQSATQIPVADAVEVRVTE